MIDKYTKNIAQSALTLKSNLLFVVLIILNIFTVVTGIKGSLLGFRVVDIASHSNYLQSSLNQIIHFFKYRSILPTSVESLYFIPDTNYFDDKGNTVYIFSHLIYSMLYDKPIGIADFSIQSLVILHTTIVILYLFSLRRIYCYGMYHGLSKSESLLSVSILNLWPFIYGNMFVNVRDTLIAIGYALFVIGLIQTIRNFSKLFRNIILMTFGATICIGTRISFLLIVMVTVSFFAIIYGIKRIKLLALIGRTTAISVVITLLLVLITNPQLWPDPINTLKKILITSSNFNQWGGRIIANGEVFDGDRAPWWYQISYLLNQVPLGYIGLFVLVQIIVIMNYNSIREFKSILVLNLIILLPLVYTIVTNPTVYSGIRQIMFILPIFVLVILHALKDLKDKLGKYFSLVLTLYLCTIVASDIGKFPLNYIYYNELNSNRPVDLNWDLDYQGISQEMLQRKYNELNPKVYPEGFITEVNFETGEFGYDETDEREFYIKYRDINLPWFKDCNKIDSISRKFYGNNVTFAEIRQCPGETVSENMSYSIEFVEFKNDSIEIELNKFLKVVDKNIGQSICLSGIMKSKTDRPIYIDVKNFSVSSNKMKHLTIRANRYSFLENQESGRNRGFPMQTTITDNGLSKFLACFDSEKMKIIPGVKYEINYFNNQVAYFKV